MDAESVRFGPVIAEDGYHSGWLVELKCFGSPAYLFRDKYGEWVTSRGSWKDWVVWLDLTDEVWRYAFDKEMEREDFKSAMKLLIFY